MWHKSFFFLFRPVLFFPHLLRYQYFFLSFSFSHQAFAHGHSGRLSVSAWPPASPQCPGQGWVRSAGEGPSDPTAEQNKAGARSSLLEGLSAGGRALTRPPEDMPPSAQVGCGGQSAHLPAGGHAPPGPGGSCSCRDPSCLQLPFPHRSRHSALVSLSPS